MSLRDAKKHEKNPFSKELLGTIETERRVKMVQSGSKQVDHTIVDNDGQIVGTTRMMSFQKVDKETFLKIYEKGLKNFADLNKSAIGVIRYIKENIEPNKDSIMLYEPIVTEFLGRKRKASFFSAVAVLIEKGFLARSTLPHIYYINPTMLFNGNRLVLAQAYELDEKALLMADNTKKKNTVIIPEQKQINLFDAVEQGEKEDNTEEENN